MTVVQVGPSMSLTPSGNSVIDQILRRISYFLVPRGGIIMWSGKLVGIPSGWQLCDGTNGAPNLVAKFIRGVATSSTEPGTVDGSDTETISIAQMPSHGHIQDAHAHTVATGTSGASNTQGVRASTVANSGSGVQTNTFNSGNATATNQNTGSGATHNNMPAYYELAYIIKL